MKGKYQSSQNRADNQSSECRLRFLFSTTLVVGRTHHTVNNTYTQANTMTNVNTRIAMGEVCSDKPSMLFVVLVIYSDFPTFITMCSFIL